MAENKDNREEAEALKSRLDEILADDEIVNRLNNSQSPEEAQKILQENGLDISLDCLKKLYEEELMEEELESVSGGKFDLTFRGHASRGISTKSLYGLYQNLRGPITN